MTTLHYGRTLAELTAPLAHDAAPQIIIQQCVIGCKGRHTAHTAWQDEGRRLAVCRRCGNQVLDFTPRNSRAISTSARQDKPSTRIKMPTAPSAPLPRFSATTKFATPATQRYKARGFCAELNCLTTR